MLLRWVLTQDEMAVRAMAERYGAVHVELGKIMHVRPETWDDVVWAYSTGDKPPTKQNLETAVGKAQWEIIPAQQKIYRALRSGTLDSWARPNGSGALIRIDPIEYERFRFRSLDGHDFVIPVDIYHEPLCPHPLAEYLTGAIPATTTPTVWPDPLFSAQQAMSLWPPHEPNDTSEPGITGHGDAPKGAEAGEASRPTPAEAVHGIDPAAGLQQAQPGDPPALPQEQGDQVSTKKRVHYRGQLATYMTRLSGTGSLPAAGGDVERNFREWYGEEARKKSLEPLPHRRAVISQIASIRRSPPPPRPASPRKATDNDTQEPIKTFNGI